MIFTDQDLDLSHKYATGCDYCSSETKVTSVVGVISKFVPQVNSAERAAQSCGLQVMYSMIFKILTTNVI